MISNNCVLIVALALGNPSDPVPTAATVTAHAWAILDSIDKYSIEPCSRQKLVLGGIAALLAQTGKVYPALTLERRTTEIATEAQLRALLEELWPKDAKAETAAELEADFIEGLLAQVPGGAHWVRPEELKVFDQIAHNRYVGTGIQLSVNEKEHVTQIPIPFPGGPARKAGVRPDDLLLAVDGKSTRDVPLRQVVDWPRGPAGTSVTMTVRQPGEQETRDLTMIRSEVPFETVQGFRRNADDRWSYRIDPDTSVGYICIKSIKSSTLHELREVERRLRTEKVQALIIDLRFVDGADDLFQHAALSADALLDSGVLWRVRDKQNQIKEVRADPECLFRGWPLAVLVNTGTQSISQNALAAALQDNRRAVVVGEPAQCDGYISTQVALPGDQGVLVLRTARLERASGSTWPVYPDAHVPMAKKQRDAIREWLRRKELPAPPGGASESAPADAQLAKAVALLRDKLEERKD